RSSTRAAAASTTAARVRVRPPAGLATPGRAVRGACGAGPTAAWPAARPGGVGRAAERLAERGQDGLERGLRRLGLRVVADSGEHHVSPVEGLGHLARLPLGVWEVG